MTSKRFNLIFKDGCEYEATIFGSGGVRIQAESGKTVFDCGSFETRDVMQILEALKDEIEARDSEYQDWIVETEEAERMELDQGEIMKALNDGAGEFMDLELFSDWSEEEKENTRTFLVEFYNVWAVAAIMKAAIVKLDKMAEEEAGE